MLNQLKTRTGLLIIGLVAIGVIIAAIWLISTRSSTTSTNLQPGSVTTRPLTPQALQTSTLIASLTPQETGLTFQNQLSPENQIKYTYNGAGVAAGDYDGDGRIDVFLANEEGQSQLFRNLGNMRFEDVTEAAGLLNTKDAGGFSMGAYFADVDDDHDLDLFITNWKVSNRLFRNNGNGTFTDITTEAGVGYAGGATTATFADYDRDGDLDFFVATYRPTAIEYETDNLQLQMVDGQVVIPPEYQDRLILLQVGESSGSLRELGERDLLYRNNGDGTFTDVAAEAGIEGGYWGLSATFNDIDNDGWADLYVTNDLWSPDQFYHNNGNGTFSPIDPDMVQHTPWFSMGIDFADINNDGLNDYFIGEMISRDHTYRMTQHGEMDMSPPPSDAAPQVMRNGLFLNNGDGSFSDIAWLADVATTDWTWTVKFNDLDLDGLVDLLITNGMVRDWMDSDAAVEARRISQEQGRDAFLAYLQQYPRLDNPNMVFRNNGDLTFTDVSAAWGFHTAVVSNGAAMSDFDGDGDLDVITNNLNAQAGVYRNDSTNQRLVVRLHGLQSNAYGIGAIVTLVTNQGIQTRVMSSSGGYLSSHDPAIIFGLGSGMTIQSLQIEWPSGLFQTLPNETSGPIQANTELIITEPEGEPTVVPPQPLTAVSPWFMDVAQNAGITWQHQESTFDDFAVQTLLPRGLSQLGPGLAWADVDNDGDDDLYLAGAAGETGALYANNDNGTFTDVTIQTPNWRRRAEEMAPLWWHNGQSSLPELFITYSRIEAADEPIGFRRFADTATPFTLFDNSWTDTSLASSSSTTAADFDGDGDLDLFVAGRVVPEHWPLPAPSRLYANQGGNLADVTADAAPELLNLGLATGSLWTDMDNDGDSDLVIATEFGPVHLFVNENGRLTDQTASYGLDQWTGLWTGVVAADFNHDGFMDLAAANLGLNTKYTASPEYPAVVYAGNVDGDGDVDIIEAYYVGDTLYPLKERGMAGAEMPFILDEFATFRAYGEATLEQIYGDRLNQVQRFAANTLAHRVFLNDGNGRFTSQPLPQLAQVTAGFGLSVADFDNDGHDDLYLVGNFSYADHETMLYTGGTSYWLRGHGNGTFTVVPSAESGLLVTHDARGVAVSDFNQDGWVDIAVAINNGRPMLFQNQSQNSNCAVGVRLAGTPVNPLGIGSRVAVTLPDGTTTTRDVHAGSGYLSQDSATLLFGVGSAPSAAITVTWPDGSTLTANVGACETAVMTK
ncbi:MAG: VCBS repeat-containing protein [Ardenticatenaceae bacterium]|nr:VCBS repeat-containing protein [Ardenticatenaceae bacterium]